MSRARTLFPLGLVVIAAVSACTVWPQKAATSTVTVTASSTPVERTQQRGVPLYESFEAQNSVGPNGQPVTASLAGTRYPNSTGMWVGCDGEPATTTYRLGGRYSRLQASAGLQPHAPDALSVDVSIAADGKSLAHFIISKNATAPVDLDVGGADALVVSAIAVDRSVCGTSDTPYGALGTAMLTPSAI